MKTPSDTCLLVHPILLLTYFKVRQLLLRLRQGVRKEHEPRLVDDTAA
jgi:hypothetical protein